MKRSPNKNIPNILSIFRIILVPFFAYAFLSLKNIPLSCIIYILAGLTDVIDGYIARKYDLISKLGTVLDPIADILLRLTVTATLAVSGLSFMWLIFGVLLLKEIFMILGSILLYRHNNIVAPARWYSKVAGTYLFIVILIMLVFHNIFNDGVQMILAFSALGVWILAFIGYVVHYQEMLRKGFSKSK